MSGLIYGSKYSATSGRKYQENKPHKQGIYLSRNGKYVVIVKNKGKNAWLNPFISIKQCNEIEEAELFLKEYETTN